MRSENQTAEFRGEHLRERLRAGDFQARVDSARRMLPSCRLCPRECGIDRNGGETGFCGIGREAVVSSYGPHFGEEPPLVGRHGSGTIFMSGCNLGCVFCQNADISHMKYGETVSVEKFAEIMLDVQSMGCHNINFVTPTHQVPQILESLSRARKAGMSLPIVYNCGGYESFEVLRLLDGIVDIYMPDAKYTNSDVAERFSGVSDYPDVVKSSLKEMHRQVGDLEVDENGVAVRGLLLRHLVLPEGLAGTADLVEFVAREISTDTYINIMGQYRPCHHAERFPELRRRVAYDEVDAARRLASQAGLHRGFEPSDR